MSFLCTFHVDGQVFPVLHFRYAEEQPMDPNGRPVSVPVHAGFHTTIEVSQASFALVWAWMVSPEMLKNGLFRWEKRDGQGAEYILEFWDGYCVDMELNGDFEKGEVATLTFCISAQRHSNQGIPFVRPWPGFPTSVG